MLDQQGVSGERLLFSFLNITYNKLNSQKLGYGVDYGADYGADAVLTLLQSDASLLMGKPLKGAVD